MYTLDANIFLRDLDPSSPDYDACHTLIGAIRVQRVPLVLPLLILAEVAGVVSCTRNDSIRARVAIDIVRDLPYTTFIPLDEALAQLAAELAADYRLRGADAVYVAVARRAGTTLVTLDAEQRARAASILRTLTPDEAIAELD